VYVGGAPNIYFSASNAANKTLSVPLTYSLLNSVYSVTGQATPPENFAPGVGGFAIPESHFTQANSTLAGVWNFLGQQVLISPYPETCTDRGIPGSCEVLDPAVLKVPFNHTRGVVFKMVRAALDAARKGIWKGSNGKYTVPFSKRGARALARMNMAIQIGSGEVLTCPVTPANCTLHTVNKSEMRKTFRSLFEGPVPQGLRHITARAKKEAQQFDSVLRKVPDQYVLCP
jgi:hypothetical protein